MKTTMSKWMIAAAVASVAAAGSLSAGTVIVDGSNLDPTSTTTGVKNEGNTEYYQEFSTGPSGNISLLTLDLSLVTGFTGTADTETFYLATYTGNPNSGTLGPLTQIGTVTAAEIATGTPEGTSSGSSIYQYTLINSLSALSLNASSTYAIVMETSSTGGQDVGWGESPTAASGDLGEFGYIATPVNSNDAGKYGQMELEVGSDPVPDSSSTMLLLGGVMSSLAFVKRKLT